MLFVERRIEKVSMYEIAKKNNYSATIYINLLPIKRYCYKRCDEDFLALASGMPDIMQLPDLIARIHALCNGYSQFALSHPNHYRLMFMTPRTPCNVDITKIQQGNIEQDAYAQLKQVVQAAFDAHLFKADITDFELIAQTLWASVHGLCSLEIALGHEPWIPWVDIDAGLRLMQSAILRGVLQHPESLN